MSIMGYLMKRHYELRMPKRKDATGINFEGPVLNGIKSVEQRLFEDAVQPDPLPSLEAIPRSLRPRI
jgi:hypothetical protein